MAAVTRRRRCGISAGRLQEKGSPYTRRFFRATDVVCAISPTATADDYLRAARAELDGLLARYRWVGVIGLSMGGALGARLAAERRDVRVLVLLAPYLTPPPSVALVGRMAKVWSLAMPYVGGRGGDASVHDPVARAASYAYGVFPPSALRALCATAAAGRQGAAVDQRTDAGRELS